MAFTIKWREASKSKFNPAQGYAKSPPVGIPVLRVHDLRKTLLGLEQRAKGDCLPLTETE